VFHALLPFANPENRSLFAAGGKFRRGTKPPGP